MIGLLAKVQDADLNWVEAGDLLDNVTGTPVASAQANYLGEAISDLYTLQFTDVVPGTSATVTVFTGSPQNPYDGLSRSVDLDGATSYDDVVPGVNLVFSDSGSFTSSWFATVSVGVAFGLINSFPPDAGTPTGETRVQVENTGSDTGSGCLARLVTCAKRVKMTGEVFAHLRPFAEDATPKLTGSKVVPYSVEAWNVTGSGSSKTMNLTADDDQFYVQDLSTDEITLSSDLGVLHYYRIVTGPLESVEFKLSEAAVEADAENVMVFSNEFTQIAPDVAGAPGDWGVTDVELTEDGEDDGDITASGVAYFWVRALVSGTGNASSNPYVCDVALQGSALGEAGWTDAGSAGS